MVTNSRGCLSLPLARPLSEDEMPEQLKAFLKKARTSWLPNTAVLALLEGCREFGLSLCAQPPSQPPGGFIFLYDKKSVKCFRKDGHKWRKKGDGKTIRETHEKLKVGNREILNCYYAHPEGDTGPQRRCYWLLDSKDDVVLVHYLCVQKTRKSRDTPGRTASSSPEFSSGSAKGRSSSGQGNEGSPEAVDNRADALLRPTMHVESCLGERPGKLGQGEPRMEEADFILPSWGELMPERHRQAIMKQQEWQARGGHGGGLEVDALPSVVVMGMGGSLRMLEDGPLESSGLEDEWMAVAPVHGQDEHPQSHISQALQHPLGNNHMVHAMPRDVRGFRTSHMTSRRSAQLPQELGPPFMEQELGSPFMEQSMARSTTPIHLTSLQMEECSSYYAYPHSAQEVPAFVEHGMPHSRLPQALEIVDFAQPTGGGFGSSLAEEGSMSMMPGPTSCGMAPSPFASPFSSQGLFSDREARALTPTCRTPVQSFGGGGQLLHTGSDALPQMARRTTSRNLGLRCVSMDLQRVMPEVRWADQMHAVEVGEDVGGSKARLARRASSSNRAGLDLEASLSNLSDNLMCHIQQNTGRLHAEQETQVRTFEEELGTLQAATAKLIPSKSAASPCQDSDLSAMEMMDCSEAPASSSANVIWEDTSPAEEIESQMLPFILHEDYAPNWDFICGGSKLILTCSLNAPNNVNIPSAQLHVLFGSEEVMALLIRPGVIKTVVPPHDAGEVELKLTMGDGRPVSNSMPFFYRMRSQSDSGLERRVMVGESDRELQHHLITMLQGHSCTSSDRESGGVLETRRSSGTSQHQQSSHPGCQSRSPELISSSPLRSMSTEQGEMLLQALIEKKVQQHMYEGMWGGSFGSPDGLDEKQKVLSALDKSGTAGVHLLAGLGYSQALDELLTIGADLSSKDAHGYTPLHWAAARGKLDGVALLAARKADVEALTFLSEDDPRQAPADTAAQAGHLGIAAFLGELQLQQAVQRLRDGRENDREVRYPQVSMQRKRSRHLPPLLDKAPNRSQHSTSSPSQAYDFAAAWPGKENTTSVAVVVSTAKQHARLLETALLRKHARQFARQEKKARAQKREIEALVRMQERREQWQFLFQQVPENRRNAMLDRCFGIGKGIFDVQQTLETMMKDHCSGANASADILQAGEYIHVESDGYGSDSDLTLSRRGSLLGQRKAQHLHDYRALSAAPTIMKTLDTDLSTLVSSGGGLSEHPALNRRCQSKSVISRALAHVERLEEGHSYTLAQYASVKQAARFWLELKQEVQGFKFARTNLTTF